MITIDIDRSELSFRRLGSVVVASPTLDAAVSPGSTGRMSDAYRCEYASGNRSSTAPVPTAYRATSQYTAHAGPSHSNGGKPICCGGFLHCTPGGMAKFHRLRAIESALAIHCVSRQDIKKAWKKWDWSPSKVDLAEESWPILHRNHRTGSLGDTIAHLLGYLPEGKAPGHKAGDPSTEGRRTPCYPVSLDELCL